MSCNQSISYDEAKDAKIVEPSNKLSGEVSLCVCSDMAAASRSSHSLHRGKAPPTLVMRGLYALKTGCRPWKELHCGTHGEMRSNYCNWPDTFVNAPSKSGTSSLLKIVKHMVVTSRSRGPTESCACWPRLQTCHAGEHRVCTFVVWGDSS